MESLAFVTAVQGAAHASLTMYSGIITAIVAASALAVFYFEKRAGKPPVVGTRMTRLAVVYACIVSTAATPTDYLFEVVAGYYILVLTICTLSASLRPEQITLTCMVNVLLASVGGRIPLRILAAFGGIISALLAQRAHTDAEKYKFGSSHRYVLELVIARLSLVPLIVDVVYAQTATHPSLRTGEAVAAAIVAIAPFGVDWEM